MGDLEHVNLATAPPLLDLESRKDAAKSHCVDGTLTYDFSGEELALFESCREEVEDKTVIGHLPVKSPRFKIVNE